MAQPIALSASQIHNHDDCRRKHWYASVAKVRTEMTAAALVFGKAVDVAVRNYLIALCLGKEPTDLVADFTRNWKRACSTQSMQFSATQSPEDLMKMGQLALEAFPACWQKTGWTVAKDKFGQPLVDRRFRVALGPETFLTGVIDLGIYTLERKLGVVDIKTGATEPSETFAKIADQLSGYHLLMHAHGQELGLPAVEKLGFLTLLKRKREVRIESVLVDGRTREELEEFIRKCGYIADDIRRGRYDRVSRLAYNTPCGMCDFAGHCIDGKSEGLIFPEEIETEQDAIAA